MIVLWYQIFDTNFQTIYTSFLIWLDCRDVLGGSRDNPSFSAKYLAIWGIIIFFNLSKKLMRP